MDKIDKRRCKHVSAHPNSLIAKCRNDDDDEDKTNQWHNYRQRSVDLALGHGRSERRQSNPPIDATGYHCPADQYRFRRHHNSAGASRVKHRVSLVPGETYRVESKNRGISRALGSQFYPGNVAVVRRTRYEDDEVDDESKYAESPEDGGNVDDVAGKEAADEEQEDASEYDDKEYEEHEADDEVDEESDVAERRVERPTTQRKSRAEPPPRGQRGNNAEPSLRRRGVKIGAGKDVESRCCHTAERNDIKVPSREEGDEEEGEEEEEEERDHCESTPYPLKKSTWRYQQLSRRDSECRNQPRNIFVERHANSERTSSAHQTRRPGTTKPEVESSKTSTRVPHTSIRNGRCSHCGVSAGQTPKTTSSRNANCRLQDSRYFIRETIGDEGEGFKVAEPPICYRTKPRRSSESRPQKYDPREEARTMDAELGAIYKSCRSKNPRESSNDLVERARHTVRVCNRREPLKNDDRYWL